MKKKKLKKRMDKLETAIFFQEQRIKELEALKPKPKFIAWKRYTEPEGMDLNAWIKIQKESEDE